MCCQELCLNMELYWQGSDIDDEDDEIKSFEERQLIEFDQEPIKMVRVDFPPVIASCHQDCNVRLVLEKFSTARLLQILLILRILFILQTLVNDWRFDTVSFAND